MSEGVPCSYCDGETLHVFAAHAEFFDNGFLRLTGENFQLFAAATTVTVGEKIGRTPYFLHMPEGGTVELPSSAAADALVAAIRRPSRLAQTLSWLERHAPLAATSTLLLLALLGTLLWRAQPAIANGVAHFTPSHIEAEAGLVGYSLIASVAQPTELDAPSLLRVRRALERLEGVRNFHLTPQVKVMKLGIPNAFALPGGILVVSDELLLLTATDEELSAILAHEIGHVETRHGLQAVLRGSPALLATTTVTADFSSLLAASANLPSLLLKTGYPAELEREADAYAESLLRDAHLNPHALDSLIRRLEKGFPENARAFSYLATHPANARGDEKPARK